MARTYQDWYKGKGPMGHYGDICANRNHRLISLSGVEDGSGRVAKGSITFFCNTCQSEITTSFLLRYESHCSVKRL
jgi:hypothetical protein